MEVFESHVLIFILCSDLVALQKFKFAMYFFFQFNDFVLYHRLCLSLEYFSCFWFFLPTWKIAIYLVFSRHARLPIALIDTLFLSEQQPSELPFLFFLNFSPNAFNLVSYCSIIFSNFAAKFRCLRAYSIVHLSVYLGYDTHPSSLYLPRNIFFLILPFYV